VGKVCSSGSPLSPGRIQSPEAFSGAKYHSPVPRCQPQPRLGDSWVHALPLLGTSELASPKQAPGGERALSGEVVTLSFSPASAFHPGTASRGDWELQLPIPSHLRSPSLTPDIHPPPVP